MVISGKKLRKILIEKVWGPIYTIACNSITLKNRAIRSLQNRNLKSNF